MIMRYKWTEETINLVKQYISEKKTYSEIASIMQVTRNSVASAMQRLKIKNPNFHLRKRKHFHLRKPVMEYFLTHTKAQTMEKFRLTESEFKSIFSIGYKIKELKHLRKDKRINHKRFWTLEELLIILRMSGIRNRNVIAKKIKRGNSRVIKEYLMKKKVKNPKYINGLSLSLVRELFGSEPDFNLTTDAGPYTMKNHTYFKIVPWVYLDDLIKNREIDPPQFLIDLVASMAKLQEWIHEGNAYGSLLDASLEIKHDKIH